MTSTGAAGISMTYRVRCTHPPVRVVWHSGQDSGAWTTRRVGFHPRPGKSRGDAFCAASFPVPPASCAWRPAVARHPGLRATAGQPGLPGPIPASHLGNGVLLFRDNRQQGFPARLLQVQFRSHCSFTPTTALQPPVFSSGQRPSANSPHQLLTISFIVVILIEKKIPCLIWVHKEKIRHERSASYVLWSQPLTLYDPVCRYFKIWRFYPWRTVGLLDRN